MEQQEVIVKLRRGELLLMEYMWRKKSILYKKEIISAMQERYKWRKSTTEILLKRLVKMKVLKKKIVSFNYEVLVTKKEYLNAIREERNINIDDDFFTRVFTTIHKRNQMVEEKFKKFITNIKDMIKRHV
ncbi:BlaI/MecI/CopY family transcriptional regulator [Clostridioides difficile]|nr:transcriptional regulator [Clostridioides difficile]EGT5471314.1 transcriptional regulator [Clostridioides difficile]MBH8091411.1 BlaI/MecI/CopY family transcriptional regulator [Clostridioides difficile]MBY1610861.1 BlaI/MecI/CopY family transcriptional regulator [Clostridioides difficile]MBY2080244.1 BlaI/MecI/CopY family transcriptional regulator [Clostridioides difficile]